MLYLYLYAKVFCLLLLGSLEEFIQVLLFHHYIFRKNHNDNLKETKLIFKAGIIQHSGLGLL